MSTKIISLRDWIEKTGVTETASLMKVGASTVRHWRRGHCLPLTEQLYKIHRFSRGQVSIQKTVIEFHTKKN